MKNPNYLCVMITGLIVIGLLMWVYYPAVETFSELEDDISYGNPASMSKRINPYVDINLKGNPDPVVYQGNGIPLIHEDHPTAPDQPSMFKFNDYSCRPECCLYSPFGCSNGCVCWEAPPQSGIEQNKSLSPRS